MMALRVLSWSGFFRWLKDVARGLKKHYLLQGRRNTMPSASANSGKPLEIERMPSGDRAETEEVQLYRVAAEQGIAGAQCRLGVIYAEGRGIKVDDREAIKWFRLAAEQGNGEAQASLGLSFASGRGVAQDFVVAHMWLNLACSSLEGMIHDRTRDFRDRLATGMTESQIAEAERRARQWEADHSDNSNSS